MTKTWTCKAPLGTENMVENLGASAPDFKKFEKRHLDVSKKS
jgi:hypothetical protein